MNIGLIVCDEPGERGALKVALELDERLYNWNIATEIIDLQDESYDLKNIRESEILLIISGHTGPLYNPQLHQFLCDKKSIFRDVRVATVMVTNEPMLAEAADRHLRKALKNLSADLLPDHLLVENPDKKFDQHYKLGDTSLDLSFYRFLFLLAFGQEVNENEEERKIA